MKFSKIRIIKVCLKFIVAVNEGQNSLEFLRLGTALSQLKPASAGVKVKKLQLLKTAPENKLLPLFLLAVLASVLGF